ncbi:MAG: hypothetical protein KA715_03860 [Xanthomonadaceae bacterium]|nr:hypothetical protein [Xanthomonadaceae bacterium]
MFNAFTSIIMLLHLSVFATPPACETLNGYDYCEVEVEGYPEKIAVISPKGTVNSVRLYFQGYIINPQYPYDRSLKSLVTSLKLYPTTQSERVIIPRSIGKCDTYKNSIPKLSQFIESLHEWIPDGAKLSLNAHSGAGAFVSNWIKEEEIQGLAAVRVFDGIYSAETVSQLETWKATHPESFLGVSFVKGWTSEKYSKILQSKILIKEYTKFHRYIPPPNAKESPHYSIVRSAWVTL